MPTAEYFIVLDAWNRLRVRIMTEHGAVVDFVVQYEVSDAEGESFLPVVRYDASHGHAHRDRLDRAGNTVRKDWLPAQVTFAEALTFAINDLQQHWRQYREQFQETQHD